MKKECKRHKWRVGSKNGALQNGKLIVTSINIWCEKCNKIIRANYDGDVERYLNEPKKSRRKK